MILVTGATGLAGSYLLYYLLKENPKVRALYREESRKEKTAFIFRNLSAMEGKEEGSWEKYFSRIEWCKGDILDIEALGEAMQGANTVYHAAAVVTFNKRKADYLNAVNVTGTANIVNLCLEMGISRLAYISSTATLSVKNNGMFTEGFDAGIEFNSKYSQSKYQAEMEVWRGVAEGLEAVIVNPGIILGWGDFSQGSVAIIRKLAEGFPFYAEGVNGFVDARDMAQILIKLNNNPLAVNQRYIVVSENISYKNLFDMIAAAAGAKLPKFKTSYWSSHLIARIAEIMAMLTGSEPFLTTELASKVHHANRYDNTKVRDLLGYRFIPLQASVNDAVRVYRN